MTAASHARGARSVRLPEPPRQNWEKWGVLLAALTAFAGGVAAFAGLDRRVASIEEQLPPGAIQRLDERTVQIQASLARLEDRAAR